MRRARCPSGHVNPAGALWCTTCGTLIATADARVAKRRPRGLVLGLAATAVSVAVAGGGFAVTRHGGVGETGRVTWAERCAASPAVPAPVRLTAVRVAENTPSAVVVEGEFAGTVPHPGTETPRPGSLWLGQLTFYLFPTAAANNPYTVTVTSLAGPYGVQAARRRGGYVDTSGFHLTVTGRIVRVSFDPHAFTDLPAGKRFGLSADTMVERFEPSPSFVGSVDASRATCTPPGTGVPPPPPSPGPALAAVSSRAALPSRLAAAILAATHTTPAEVVLSSTADPGDPSWRSVQIAPAPGRTDVQAASAVAHLVGGTWRVVDIGSAEVGCNPSTVPRPVRAALHLACPRG